MSYGGNKPDRTISPGSLSEDERRKLIAQQRSALYGEGPFSEGGGYVDEVGAPRSGLPGPQGATLRGHSPLAYDYGRGVPPVHPDLGSQPSAAEQGAQAAGGPNEPSRANSNSSPQSNPPGTKAGGMFDAPGAAQQSSRTSASSPGGSPPRGQGGVGIGAPGTKPSGVAPIGTRPSVSGPSGAANPALNKGRSTTPLPSPLSQGYSAASAGVDENVAPGGGAATAAGNVAGGNAVSAGAEVGQNAVGGGAGAPGSGAPGTGLSGWGARPNGGWGSKPGLGVQASVWG